MVARRLDARGDARREPRLQGAAFAGGEPPRGEPKLALELVQARQLLGLVAVDRHVHRARPPVADGLAGLGFELARERRVALGRSEVQLEQRLLAEVGLGHRGKHPGRDAGGTPRRLAGIQHERAQAALSRAPANRQADHAGPDHHELSFGSRHRHHSLHGRRSRPPSCAGITRIRFDGRRRPAALSAR